MIETKIEQPNYHTEVANEAEALAANARGNIEQNLVNFDAFERQFIDDFRAGDKPFWLPVGAFYYAAGFEDWSSGRGGKNEKNEKNGRSSAEYERQLSADPQRAFQPIKHVEAIITKDGSVMLALQGDGAHRLLAAMQRHEDNIAVSDFFVTRTDLSAEEIIEKYSVEPASEEFETPPSVIKKLVEVALRHRKK